MHTAYLGLGSNLGNKRHNIEQAIQHIEELIIEMAHTLDIRVVSEGIETVEQLEMLSSINCEIGQGFLFAKPMPIADYDKMIQDYSAS